MKDRTRPQLVPGGSWTGAARSAVLLLGLLSLGPTPAARAAEISVGPGDDLVAALKAAHAGDEVVVSQGVYETGGYVSLTWAGTADAPIVVRGAQGARPVIQGVPSQNVLNVAGSYYTLRGFEIRGGSHGVRLGASDHGTLDDLVIHNVEDVAVSMNRPGETYASMTVQGCELYDTGKSGTGEGMYLGCNDGACLVHDSRIVGNLLHDIHGSQGDGIELKTGSWGNVLADNVILGTQYPAITLYGYADTTRPANVIERNFVLTTGDNGVQIVGQVVVRNNVIIGAAANGVHAKPSQGMTPHDLLIAHNTILGAGSACLKGNDWGGQPAQRITNNALYCPDTLAIRLVGGADGATLAGNVILGGVEGLPARAPALTQGRSETQDFPSHADHDYVPAADAPLATAGAPEPLVTVDFDGAPRDAQQPTVGAYELPGAASSAHWTLGDGKKPPVEGPAPVPPLPPDDGPEAGPEASPELAAERGPEPGGEPRPEEALDAGPTTGAELTGDTSPSSSSGGCQGGGTSGAPAAPGAALTALALLALAARRRRPAR